MPVFWGYPPPPRDYPYHWVILDPKSKGDKVKVTNLKKLPKFQIVEFWNGHYTRHTFWCCLIRCANMKWIRWVLLKIQSGHNSVHRRTDGQRDWRTDGQMDKVIPVYNFVEAEGIIIHICTCSMAFITKESLLSSVNVEWILSSFVSLSHKMFHIAL